MDGEDSPLIIALKNGRSLRVSMCRCGHCDNEWYVADHDEFKPVFCCYCGIKFVREDVHDIEIK